MISKSVLCSGALALCLAFTVVAQEQKVNQKEVPAKALAAATKAYPKAQIKGWEKETKEGKTLYEVTMVEAGAKWQVVFEADGTLVAREEVILVTSLPAVVRDAVKAKYPKANLHSAEKITRPADTEYEVGLKNAPKKEMVLNSAGKILSEE
jgi:glucose/arabinose dehydrogenase